jgi:hypothetical protein
VEGFNYGIQGLTLNIFTEAGCVLKWISDKLDLLDHIVVMEFRMLFIKVNKQLPSHEVILTMNELLVLC